MTERGVRLFNQGRIQESIDQFTKAIALDPNYTQAWARRAEAYARLGRGEEAAEDRRRLDALDASSSTG
jgi:Tfp pilus assembly protein PilF